MERQKRRQYSRWSQRTKNALFVIALLGLLVGIPGAFFIAAATEADDYVRAIPCPQGAPEQDCRQMLAGIVAKHYIHEGVGRYGPTESWRLDLRLSDDSTRTAELSEKSAWQSIDTDQAVTIEWWRGRITRLWVADQEVQIGNNPTRYLQNLIPLAWIYFGFGILAGILAMLELNRRRMARRASNQHRAPASDRRTGTQRRSRRPR